jgi:hypothetical protein
MHRSISLASLRTVLVELTVMVGGYEAYSVVRVLVAGDEARAVWHGLAELDAERSLHLAFELPAQQAALHAVWLVQFFNLVYLFLYLPFIAAAAVYLFVRDRALYAQARRTFLISGAIGLLIFARFPVAPPRLLGAGFADTVQSFDPWASFAGKSAVNQYAAIPSFHFGWSALAAYCVARTTTRRGPRIALWAVSPLMLVAIVITGNHLWADAAVGLLVVAASYGLAAAAGHIHLLRRARRDRLLRGDGDGSRPGTVHPAEGPGTGGRRRAGARRRAEHSRRGAVARDLAAGGDRGRRGGGDRLPRRSASGLP